MSDELNEINDLNESQEFENNLHESDEKQPQPEPSIRESRTPAYRKWIKRLWIAFGVGFLMVFLLFLYLSFDNLPTFEELENPQSRLASEIYTEDGKLLGRYYTENRVNVSYDELSPHLVEALVATEDERYYSHSGIDAEALGRVLFKTIILQKRTSGGGSTITQQLAKLLFDRPDLRNRNTISKAWILGKTKLKEWITAVKLERSYTKEEIITMYLNQFNFINGAYGIKSASEIYFGTTPDSLRLEEAAMLVGMLKNPSLYNPKRFPEKAKNRRTVVFSQMKRNGLLNQVQYDSLKNLPLDLSKFKRSDHNDGLAPYFREYLREDLKRLLAGNEKADGTSYNVYKDGLRIYTTINSRLQMHAEAAALDHLPKVQEKLFKHWNKKDPWTHKSRGVTDKDIDTRLKSLENRKRETERFLGLRKTYLKKSQELNLRDVDIERLFMAEEDKTIISRWLSSKFIGSELAKKYRTILGGEDWAVIKAEWRELDEVSKEVFDTPVEMKVFDYNTNFEKDTVMSPLDSIRYHRMFLQTGIMAVDPQTGYVKAWVGGIHHRTFKFDHVNKTMARQIGSTVKPFLYAVAIDQRRYSPCYKVMDSPVTIEKGTFNLLKDWTPKNVGYFTNQLITLQEGLRTSKNSVSAYLMRDMGTTEPMRELMYKMGVDTSRVPSLPSISLGTPDISVFEMTGAYTAFANEGIATMPVYITRIEDKNGNLIYESMPEQQHALGEQANHVMVQMLKNVVGFSLGIKSEVGGKTGTTNYHADGWFVGFTPNIVVGTWVGCDDRFIRFRTIDYGQGSYMAKPIFSKFMKRVEADEELAWDTKKRFKRPSAELEIEMDCTLYDNPSDNPLENEGELIENDPEGEEGDDFEFGGG
ncbi:MAG: transglycosylase domain-containing protein [Bacteroidota bacterium]